MWDQVAAAETWSEWNILLAFTDDKYLYPQPTSIAWSEWNMLLASYNK